MAGLSERLTLMQCDGGSSELGLLALDNGMLVSPSRACVRV